MEDGVLVLGATNRPGVLDAALLRSGRFDRVVYVRHPNEVARRASTTIDEFSNVEHIHLIKLT